MIPASSRRFPLRRLTLVIALSVLLYGLIVVVSYVYYANLQKQFDQELRERLLSSGRAASALLDRLWLSGALLGEEDSLASLRQRETVRKLSKAFELTNIFVVDKDGRTLLTASPILELYQRNPFLEEDGAAVEAAWQGQAQATRLYAIDTLYFKAAYIPYALQSGKVIAVVGVEAGVSYFGQLNRTRRLLIYGNLLLGGGVLIITLFILAYLRRIDRMEEVVIRSGQIALLGQLSGMVAHEVRNPLAIIRGSAERLKRKYVEDDAGREIVDYILEESQRLESLLTNYLEFARPEHGSFENILIDDLVAGVVEPVSREYSGKGYRISWSPQAPDFLLTVQSRGLRQAILNLMLNGIQAQPEGGSLDIRSSVESDGSQKAWRLSIHDRGPGLSGEAKKHLFEPFWTSKEKGSGLGLFLVQRVIGDHHGRVDFQNHPEGGLEVVITLPADHDL